MLASLRPDEEQRLAAIRRYDLGARMHEGTFDGLVELAAQACDCPVALVSIVHEDRQRFEAHHGIDEATAEASEPLEMSICSHAILERDLVEIADMRLDIRTRENPVVTGPDPVLFYAGAPIVTRAGLPLGTLCVLDRRPRRLGDGARRALRLLAGQVMNQLELYDALRQQDAMRREVDHRVRNSLANVGAMVRMAARGAGEEARDVLEEVERRISVMVELHSDLYRVNEPNAPVEVTQYLTRVAANLQAMAPLGVEIETRFEPLSLVSRRASALGVLVNEMIANACKHAFPEGRAGRIVLTGQRVGGGRYRIVCQDDGVGSGAISLSGIGQRIMDASAAQLDGLLRAIPGPTGYRTELDFPLEQD